MFRTANYFQSFRASNGGYIGAGSNQEFIDNTIEWETITKLAALWKEPCSEEDILCKYKEHYGAEDKGIVKNSIETLKRKNFLIKSGVYEESEKLSRNVLYFSHQGIDPSSAIERLNQCKVTLIGCGGIGNYISYKLVASGVKKITLVDDDFIEESNLTRQFLFTLQDVGLNKIDVAERELVKRNPDVEIRKIHKCITKPSDLEELPDGDLWVVSADSPSNLMDLINSFCVSKKQPYINVGYINDISVTGPFYIPGKTSCYNCRAVSPKIDQRDPLKDELYNILNSFKPATFSGVNGVAASYAFTDIVRYLAENALPLSASKRIGIHSNKIEIEVQDIPKNESCTVCGIE